MIKLHAKQKSPPKRKAGTRAGLNRDKIMEAAIVLWSKKKSEEFSIRALAKALGVAPVTIRNHFEGGTGDILDGIAHSVLDELAPPYVPQTDAKDYLKKIFRTALTGLGASPSINRQVVLRLADRPLLSPQFAERVCATLSSLAPKSDPAVALQLVINRLSGVILIETGSWALDSSAKVEKKIEKLISELPPAEFPTLHKAAKRLGKDYGKRTKQNYLDEVAAAATAEVIAELKSTTSQ